MRVASETTCGVKAGVYPSLSTHLMFMPSRKTGIAGLSPATALITDLALLAFLWIVGCIAINPFGEFPLIDDWSFARDVRHLVETGNYQTTGWGAMTLLTHVLWGSLFCLPAGFSFTALRFSSIFAGLLGLMGAYLLIRDFNQPRWLSVLVACTLASFPAYCLLSYTFMTDVSFAALAIWSLVFLARNLRSDSTKHVLLGSMFAVLAILCRQVGLAIPLAFLIVSLVKRKLTILQTVRAAVPFVACIASLPIYNHWATITQRGQTILGNVSNFPFGHPTGMLLTMSFSTYFVHPVKHLRQPNLAGR